MSHVSITSKLLNKLEPAVNPYFLRDSNLKGFGVKVNQSGEIKFFAEVCYKGKSKRITIGAYPFLGIQDAKSEALTFISAVKSGAATTSQVNNSTLQTPLDEYISGDRLKPHTVQDHLDAIGFHG